MLLGEHDEAGYVAGFEAVKYASQLGPLAGIDVASGNDYAVGLVEDMMGRSGGGQIDAFYLEFLSGEGLGQSVWERFILSNDYYIGYR